MLHLRGRTHTQTHTHARAHTHSSTHTRAAAHPPPSEIIQRKCPCQIINRYILLLKTHRGKSTHICCYIIDITSKMKKTLTLIPGWARGLPFSACVEFPPPRLFCQIVHKQSVIKLLWGGRSSDKFPNNSPVAFASAWSGIKPFKNRFKSDWGTLWGCLLVEKEPNGSGAANGFRHSNTGEVTFQAKMGEAWAVVSAALLKLKEE